MRKGIQAAVVLLVLCLPVLPACASMEVVDDGVTGSEPRQWVAREITGGRQCDPREDFEPPNTIAQLEEAGIAVHRVGVVEKGALCASCDCPTYAATHFALVDSGDVERAAELGFVPSPEPGTEAR